jgi:hypothetical protein
MERTMELKPWYHVVQPRADLREGKPLDAAEFAVHLEQVRDGRAASVYQNPREFFERTYLTENLTKLGSEVIRRLSGERTESAAVFNMATQFGGGKTHALTMLYHLATHGAEANNWIGVQKLLSKAGVSSVPNAAVAVFVGTEFDSLAGRGGNDGAPVRKTPWGEIAYQLGGAAGFAAVAQHDEEGIAPGGDVIRQFLPARACLILMDEIMNYASRYKARGLAGQLYNFIQNLSEEVRGRDNTVLAVSIPASEIEMNVEDQGFYEQIKKLLDRVGKPIMMAAEAETSEIIRRRLFEWDVNAVNKEGKVLLRKEALETCRIYGEWAVENRLQLPQWFPVDNARDKFAATYPFHPSTLSVFERKWQTLPRFQQTRGMLRLLALWVSKAYMDGFKQLHKDPLIGLGTAPLEESMFRAAMFEQLGEHRLEAAVVTDIVGSKESHAMRLDAEAGETIKKARLHRKAATAIFFESNGGFENAHATVPEIRLDVLDPSIDIGNVETVLEGLTESCYFLRVEKNRYRFSLTPNLNKLLADRRANIASVRVEEQVRAEVMSVFNKGGAVEKVYFPAKSGDIPDRPVLTLVVMPPEQGTEGIGGSARTKIESMTREYGASARTFKSALLWAVPVGANGLYEDARKLLAWEAIEDEAIDLRLDDSQRSQLNENVGKAERDLREGVWRAYKLVMLLGKDSSLQEIDLGLIHSSAGSSLAGLILDRLKQHGQIEDFIGPNFLVRNWPPAFKEWSTRAVRNAFYASPIFPRLTNPDSIKETISRGVREGLLGYVGKSPSGIYEPSYFATDIAANEIEISDDMYIITGEEARRHVEPRKLTTLEVWPKEARVKSGDSIEFRVRGLDQNGAEIELSGVEWDGDGGKIDKEGRFVAGDTEGKYTVTATVDGMKGWTMVSVTSIRTGGSADGEDDSDSSDEGETEPDLTTITWSGEITPQKWTNFYMKVLSKLVQDGELHLNLTVDAKPKGNVQQKAQEIKMALRELGLSEDLEVE